MPIERKRIPVFILSNLAVISLFLVVFFTSMDYYFLNEGFYKAEFEKNGLYDKYGQELVDNVSDNIINFYHGKEPLKYFNEKERSHLHDVLRLRDKGIILYAEASFILIMSIVSLFMLRYSFGEINKFFSDLSLIFIIGGSLMIFISLIIVLFNGLFPYVFRGFHKVFFTGNWMFPSDSLMVGIFTGEFFYDITKNIFGMSLIISAILMVGSFATFYFSKYLGKYS